MPDIKMRLLLLLSLFVITTCYGQEKDYKNIQFKQYNSIQGLQTAACDNIYQDKYGFLWISTYYGISIFDGTHFFNLPMYTQDSAFNLSQKPHTFLQKDSFNMVISSPNGLYTYNYRTHTITKNKQQPIPIGRETIKLLGKSKTGNNIHLKTFSTFYTIDSADKIIDKKELNGPGYEKDAIHIGSYTSHYFLTKNNQLIEHNLSDNSSKPLLKLPYKPKFAILNTENRQQAIICTDKYLYHLPANAESPLVKLDLSPYETNPSALPINDISCDQQGNYWIGGMNKLLVYFPKEQKLLNLRPQLAEAGGRSDTHIVDIINNKDEVYLSTTMSGILISNRSDLVTNINNFPKGGDIVGTIALKKNTLLCGNSSNVINRISYSNDSYQVSYNPVKNIHTTFIAHLENLDENHTWAIYWDKFKLDIINTQKMEALNLNFPIDEVSRQHKESFKMSLPTKDAIPIIKKINDSLFWFTANNKLYKVTGAVSRGFQFSLIDSIKGNHYFTSIDLPDPGHVYLGTSGLQVFQLVNGKLEKIIDEFNSNIPVRYVLEDGNKHKYLLTTNGIYVYKATNQFSHRLSAETNQINGNIIYSGYIDQSNILWAATNAGIIAYDCQSNSVFKLSSLRTIANIEFNTKSIAVDSTEIVYFGGSNGISKVNTHLFVRKDRNFYVFFYSIKNQDQLIHNSILPGSIVEKKDFPYFKSNFSFSIHAISSFQVEPFELRYKMEGIDSTWRIPNNLTIDYFGLKPGSYKLRVYGKYPDSEQVEEVSYSFTIALPFWKESWFYLLISGIFSVLIFLATNYWYRKKTERQKIILANMATIRNERERISQELHDDLGSGLTSIRLLSKSLLANPDSPRTNKMLTDISRIAGELIDQMSEIIWVLNHSDDTFNGLIAHLRIYMAGYLQRIDLPIRLQLNSTVPDSLHISNTVRRNILLVIKEAFHNTVKHADASLFSIDCNKTNEGLLEIKISDNGKGFFPDLSKPGNGLNNIRKRISSINGSVTWNNQDGTQLIILIAQETTNPTL